MNKSKGFALSLLISLLFISALSVTVSAQNQATVVMLDAVGGTATPAGTTTYPGGTDVTLTASSSDTSFAFVNWIISSDQGTMTLTDNPATVTVTAGNTYAIQPVFEPVVPIGNTTRIDYATAAIVVVLPSAGGTTDPPAGQYALANASSLNLKATANSGYTFKNWVISGSDVNTGHGSAPTNLTPTDNPYKVDHGYGNTYYYQAVFQPTSSGTTGPTSGATSGPTSGATTGPSPTVPEIPGAAVIGAVAAMGLVVVATFAYKRKTK